VNLKTKETWYRVLGHYDAEYDTAQRVFKGQWCGRYSIRTATPTATCMSGICTGTTVRGTGATTGSTMIGTATTLLRCSQLS